MVQESNFDPPEATPPPEDQTFEFNECDFLTMEVTNAQRWGFIKCFS